MTERTYLLPVPSVLIRSRLAVQTLAHSAFPLTAQLGIEASLEILVRASELDGEAPGRLLPGHPTTGLRKILRSSLSV